MGNQPSVPPQYYQQGAVVDVPKMAPRELFGLEKNFTIEQLKAAYKRLVLLVHPDKGGSEVMFQHVTECFRVLYTELQSRVVERGHHELKAEYERDRGARDEVGAGAGGAAGPVGAVGAVGGGRVQVEKNGKFSSAAFNKLYDDVKIETDDDFGYGDRMAASSKVREDIEVPREIKKYSSRKFNKEFEKKVAPVGTAVTVYEEPEAMLLTKKLAFVEIGQKPDDFSSPVLTKSVQYMDYMRAHTTSRLVDPRVVKERGEFKSVDQFEAHRERVTQTRLTDEEIERRHKREQEAQRAEEERLRRVEERDRAYQSQFQRVNNLLGRV